MEIRDLRAVVAVARSCSFTVAATELGYTQSAISQQVAALELELGQQLFDRRPVRPTAAGRRLVEHASRILLRVDAARSEFAQTGGAERELRVDACPLAVPATLAQALRALHRSRPALEVLVRTTDAATAVGELASGTADASLVGGLVAPDNPLAVADAGLFDSTALAQEYVAVALPTNHPLARRKWVDLTTLVDAPWVSAPGLPGVPGVPTLRGSVTYQGSDVITVLELVASGHGAALVPSSIPIPSMGVATVPVRRPEVVHRTEVLVSRSPSHVAGLLVDALRDAATMA